MLRDVYIDHVRERSLLQVYVKIYAHEHVLFDDKLLLCVQMTNGFNNLNYFCE